MRRRALAARGRLRKEGREELSLEQKNGRAQVTMLRG